MNPLLTPFPYQGTSNVGNTHLTVRNESFAYPVSLTTGLKCTKSLFVFRFTIWASIKFRKHNIIFGI